MGFASVLDVTLVESFFTEAHFFQVILGFFYIEIGMINSLRVHGILNDCNSTDWLNFTIQILIF